MPTYEYLCVYDKTKQVLSRNVDERDDEVLCLLCSKGMRRIYSPTPTHFKTGGFYKTGN